MVPLAPRAAAANGTTRYEFFRHGQIYQSDVLFRPRSEVIVGSAPGFIVLMILRSAIPRQVGLHQSPPPLHRLEFILNPAAETVNHHPVGAGEFSTGEMRNFQPALTKTPQPSGLTCQPEAKFLESRVLHEPQNAAVAACCASSMGRI